MLPFISLTSLQSAQRGLEDFLRTRLWAKLLLALVLGIVGGYALLALEQKSQGSWARSTADWLALPGSVYLAVIQMVIVPLVLSSIVLALSGVGQRSKTIGTSAMIFVVLSTFVAATIGVTLTELLQPGAGIRATLNLGGGSMMAESARFNLTPETILRFIPTNPLASLLKGDLLEVLIISFLFGLVLSQMEEKHSAPLKQFLVGTQSLCLRVITMIMRIAPLAVFGLMLRAVVHSGLQVLSGMFGYLACTFAGFIVMALLYAIWILLITGMSPLSFFSRTKEALLLAFSLSSSAATMPTTLRVAKENLAIEDEIAELVIPLGTTVNMAGSAIWQTSATLFLAQAFGNQVSTSTLLMVIALSVGASIGTPGVPGAGLGVLTATLRNVGVPPTGIPLILGVDRLVDMGCTVINVMGDLVMSLTAQWAVKRKKRAAA